jgi:restriction endonuclease Mrr
MKTIRIDDEVWAELQSRATPLVDTPNSVLRKILGLDMPRKKEKPVTENRKRPTPHIEFRIPILETLVEMEGKGEAKAVLKRVEKKMRGKLARVDYEKIPSGDVRWHKNANWEKYFMKEEGLLRGDSPRGIWEITDKGRRYLQSSRGF